MDARGTEAAGTEAFVRTGTKPLPSLANCAGATTSQPGEPATGDAEAAGEDTGPGPGDNPTTGPITAATRPTGAAGTPTASHTSPSPENELLESSNSPTSAQAVLRGGDRLKACRERLDTGHRSSELSPPLGSTVAEPLVARATPCSARSLNIAASTTRGTGPHTAGDITVCTSTRVEDTAAGDSTGRGAASTSGVTRPHTTGDTTGDSTGDEAGRGGRGAGAGDALPSTPTPTATSRLASETGNGATEDWVVTLSTASPSDRCGTANGGKSSSLKRFTGPTRLASHPAA
ncbi:uncharacterized protein [Procambarus clarkii]|uniref:uncharacterized protein n=1 Tax=Procambarus clarkii TaxID=6728 RepID=UPI00374399A8